MRKYVGTRPQRVVCVDEIFTIHYFEYVRNFVGALEMHDFWEMVYVDCGSINAIAAGERVPLRQGEAYFHVPNEPHQVASTGDGFSSVFIISFSASIPDTSPLRHRKCKLDADERDLISRILRENEQTFVGALDVMDQTQLVRRDNSRYGGEQLILSLLEQLLIHIIRDAMEPVERTSSITRPKHERSVVDTIINILHDELYSRLTLDDICQRVRFSKSYVGTQFKGRMGCGVIHYFDRLKIHEAKRMISEGSMSFTAIADALGFGSIHYFSRTFKSHAGMNPSDYAKSVKSRGLL